MQKHLQLNRDSRHGCIICGRIVSRENMECEPCQFRDMTAQEISDFEDGVEEHHLRCQRDKAERNED